jgi:hypothetical protein
LRTKAVPRSAGFESEWCDEPLRFAVAVVTWSWGPNDRPPDWLALAGLEEVLPRRHLVAAYDREENVTSISWFVRADIVNAPNLDEIASMT